MDHLNQGQLNSGGMALRFGHVNIKQRLKREQKSWDKASGDDEPCSAGGIDLGRQ